MEQEDLKMRVQETIVRQKNISDAIAVCKLMRLALIELINIILKFYKKNMYNN